MGLGLNGELVHARRCAAGLTIAALADHVGVHADVIWAIEQGDDHQLGQLTVATLVMLANSLHRHPSELFAGADPPSAPAPTPDEVILESALLEHGATVNLEDLALALGWGLARLERALAALHQRLALTGARLHPVGIDRYVIKPNRRALEEDAGAPAESAAGVRGADAAWSVGEFLCQRSSNSSANCRKRVVSVSWTIRKLVK